MSSLPAVSPQLPLFPAEKWCPRCRTMLPVSAFGHNQSTKDGLQSYCTSCRRAMYAGKQDQTRAEREARNAEQRARRAAERRAVTHKHCPKCDRTKSIDEFYRVASRGDGHAAICNECSKAQVSAYNKAHRAERTAYTASRREANREQFRQWRRTWMAAHPDKDKEYRTRRFEKDPERQRQLSRESYHRNKSTQGYRILRKRSKHLRRTREHAAPATLTATEWRAILDAAGNCCLMCQRPFSGDLPPTVDHIKPVSQGGGLTADNVQPLCAACNLAKGTRSIDLRI